MLFNFVRNGFHETDERTISVKSQNRRQLMKNLKIFLLFGLLLIVTYITIVNNNKITDLENAKIPSFATEIKILKNVQRQQEKQAQLSATINQLSFVLQSTELTNKELFDFIKDTVKKYNELQLRLQKASIFIDGLLEENEALRKQLDGKTT